MAKKNTLGCCTINTLQKAEMACYLLTLFLHCFLEDPVLAPSKKRHCTKTTFYSLKCSHFLCCVMLMDMLTLK